MRFIRGMRMIVWMCMRVVMIVMMAVIVRVMMIRSPQGPRPSPQQHGADPDDRKARNNPENAGDAIRHHVSRDKQRRDSEQEHTGRMGERDACAQQRGMFRRAA